MAKKRTKRTFGNVYESRGRWRVRYSIDGKRYDVTGGDTQEAAEAVLARITLERQKARLDGRPITKPLTLAQFEPRLWALWGRTLADATIANRASVVRRYAAALTRPMRDVTPQEVNAAVLARIAQGAAPRSIDTDIKVMSSAWGVAIQMQVATTNPWRRRGLHLPKLPRENPKRISERELRALYAETPPQFMLAMLLMAEAGFRRKEVAALLWGDVADDRGSVTVRAAVAKSRRERTVPATDRLRAALAAAPPALPTAHVAPLTLHQLNDGVRQVADAVGLTWVTCHTLRHHFGHTMAEAGVSAYVLRDLLGHRSIKTTEIYMGSASERAMREAVQQAQRHRDASTGS